MDEDSAGGLEQLCRKSVYSAARAVNDVSIDTMPNVRASPETFFKAFCYSTVFQNSLMDIRHGDGDRNATETTWQPRFKEKTKAKEEIRRS